jgi:ABC-type Fe3+ transport system permease subunit
MTPRRTRDSQRPRSGRTERPSRGTFLVRRIALLTLVVACLVVPVVAVAMQAFGPHGSGTSSELVCSQTTDPCQLPKSATSATSP